jgi:hypothetical protein
MKGQWMMNSSGHNHKPPLPPNYAQLEMPRSWAGIAFLVVAAIGGILGLTRFAYHVAKPASEENGGIIVRSEIISVWVHPAILALGHDPAALSECRTPELFRRLAEAGHIEKAWYLITVKAFLANGEIVIMPTICRPYDMLEPRYSEFLDILALAAGRPPRHIHADPAFTSIRVIPDRFLDANPPAVIDALGALEEQPEETTSGHRSTP